MISDVAAAPNLRSGLATLRIASVLAILLLAAQAEAQPAKKGAAKEYVDRAVAEYNLGHFAESIALFEKAYQLDPAPILLFNIAQCHRQSGNNERALFFYRRYLEQDPESPNRPDVEKRVAELERAIQEQAALRNRPPPDVATGGAVTTERPAQQVAPQPPDSNSAPPMARTDMNAPLEPAAPDGSRRLRTFAWVSAGAAVAGLGAGLGFHLAASGNLSDFNNSCGLAPGTGTPVADPTRGGLTDGQCAQAYDDWKSDRRLAIAGYVAGAALGITSGILFFASRAGPRAAARTAFTCAPAVNSVFCRVVF